MAAAEPRDFLSQYPGWREGIRPKAFTNSNSKMNWEEIFKLITPYLPWLSSLVPPKYDVSKKLIPVKVLPNGTCPRLDLTTMVSFNSEIINDD